MNKIKNLCYFLVNSAKYLSCCTSEIMKPEPKICGKTIQDIPGFPIDSVPSEWLPEIKNVSMNS